MGNQQFSINQKVFEINFFSKTQAHELQNRISALVNGELPVLMNRYFETVIPEEMLYKIDHLVLDIGEVLYENLEAELTAKFMEALMKELSDRFRFINDPGSAQRSGISVSHVHTSNIDLLEYFLLTGRLPWWANREVDMEEILQELFNAHRPALREMLVRIGKHEYVRRRLASRFRDIHMHRIIETLEPQEAMYVLGYHKEVVKVQQEEQLVVAEQKEFEKAVWLFILNYLLADRGGEFNRKVFTKSTLVQIAAFFNVTYADLLHVFLTALRANEMHSGQLASLEQTIRELFNEDVSFSEQRAYLPASDHAETETPDAVSVMGKLDLVRYYMAYGTLPTWASHLTREQLTEVFMELASIVPQTFRQALVALGTSNENTQRLFSLFGAAGVKAFLKRIDPGKARSIIHIGSTFEMLQAEKLLVSSGNQAFQEVLWKLILDIVMVSRMTVTDDKVVIHSVIAGLRKYYGLPLAALVENINEGIRSVFYKDTRNLKHIAQFQRALEEYAVEDNEKGIRRYAGSIVDTIEERSGITVNEIGPETGSIKDTQEKEYLSKEDISLRDLLRFLITHGSMPWWGRQFFSQTPVQLLERLTKASVREAILLFRFAGTRRTTKARFLIQFPESFVLNIIREMPAGKDAIRLFEQLRSVLQIAAPETDISWMIVVLWDELIDHDYQFATDSGLFMKAVLRLAEAGNREALQVIESMQYAVSDWKGEAVSYVQQLLERIRAISYNESKEGDIHDAREKTPRKDHIRKKKKVKVPRSRAHEFVLQEHLFSSFAMLVPPKGSSEIDIVKEWLAASEETVRVNITGKIFFILDQFLKKGHLPDTINISDNDTANAFVKKLLVLAYHVDSARLLSIFEQQQGALAVAHMAGLLQETAGGDERIVANFLDPVIRKYSYPFDPATSQPAETQTGIVQKSTEQLSVDDLESMVAAYSAERSPLSTQQMLSGAFAILHYFLLWNKFPPGLPVPVGAPPVAILNRLLLFLFRTDKDLLRVVLRDEESQSAAVITVYTAVNSMKGGEEKLATDLIRFAMQPLVQKAMQQTGDQVIVQFKRDEETITQAEQLAAQLSATDLDKRTAESLLRDQNAIAVISERNDIVFYDTLMERTGYMPFSDYEAVSENMIRLLSAAFADSLIRERMIVLFRRFNMQLAAGKQNFQNRSDYFFSFFTYIEQFRSPAGNIWQQVLGYLEQVNNETLPAISKDMAGMRRGLRMLLKYEDDRVSSDTALAKDVIDLTERYLAEEEEVLLKHTKLLAASDETAVIKKDGNSVSGETLSPQEVSSQHGAKPSIEEEIAAKRKALQDQIARELEKERLRNEEERKKRLLEEVKEKNTKIFIANSGLVILHPFFSTFFSRLGLVEKGMFIDEEKRVRAVLLLQYLVTGREKFEEHELVLNKIVCAMPLEEPVPVEIELSQQEKDLAEELFDVLKQRWDKVKNSSTAGIRASFLQREGALQEIEEGWTLRVDQRGYDMLLQTLPWAFGFIKMPWMTKILTVEWI